MLLDFNPLTEMLVVLGAGLRRSAIRRDTLNGYQKGRCFYCVDTTSIEVRALKVLLTWITSCRDC